MPFFYIDSNISNICAIFKNNSLFLSHKSELQYLLYKIVSVHISFRYRAILVWSIILGKEENEWVVDNVIGELRGQMG